MMDRQGVKLTPIQSAMIRILQDGLPHHRTELKACCGPSSLSSMKSHIVRINRRLASIGEAVLCVQTATGPRYRLVRLLGSPYNGRR